jgi:SAM-dependent methyltransferase
MAEVATQHAPPSGQQFTPGAIEVDMVDLQQFVGHFLADMSGAAICTMCALGDRLGLFRDIGQNGPATSTELATRTSLSERYVREWLLSLTAAGYLVVDGETERFSLPAAQAAALAFEESPFYMGDMSRLLPALTIMLDKVSERFRSGRGVSQDDYPIEFYETMWRKNTNRLSKVLVQQWIPLIDGLAEKLESGARVAQIECENGQALIVLAVAFPNTRFTGYDQFEPHLERACAEATAAGVNDRVKFHQGDAADHLSGQHDLIICLDALHDTPNPVATLKKVFGSLDPDGIFLLLETVGKDRAVDNTGPAAAILYAISTLYSIPVRLDADVDRLGMLGLSQNSIFELCQEAGFQSVRPLLSPSPFNTLYEIRP